MAKYIAQIVVTGLQIVGRAFGRALKQEFAASQNAARARQQSSSDGARSGATDAVTGLTVQEAKQILNLDDLDDRELLEKNYKHLFSVNERSNGGSLYIQSKVIRAKERIDQDYKYSEPKEEHKSDNKDDT